MMMSRKVNLSLTLKLIMVVLLGHWASELLLEHVDIPEMVSLLLENVVLVGTVFVLGHLATKQLREMTQISQSMSEKDFSRRVAIRSRDEVGELADSLNQMADSLQNAFENLEMKNEYISNLNRNFEVVTAELEETNKALREAQAQLLQQEKLASVGQLAAGVAHEINNPLGFINSNLGTLQGYVQDMEKLIRQYEIWESALAKATTGDSCGPHQDLQKMKEDLDINFLLSDVRKLVEESRDGVDRVKKIVQDLKEFSHVDRSEWETTDLHKGLDSTLNIAWNELKYRIQVIKEYGEIPNIHCYPQELNQVFMNLLINAAQSITGNGEIRIRTEVSGEYAVVSIRDTGSGIPEDIRRKIFDPFFTTKPVGQGTGLGLSIVYGIIKRHQGRIEVQSEIGKGTTFRIHLPIHNTKPEDSSETTSMTVTS